MKTLAPIRQGNCLFTAFAFLLFTWLLSASHAQAQLSNIQLPDSTLASSTPTKATITSTTFRASAFSMLTPMQVRVVFENSTRYKVHVTVNDSQGKILYSQFYSNTPKYYGVLDFSQFPNGDYTLEISCGPIMGKHKTCYKQNFQIRSQTEKDIIAFDRKLAMQLYTRRAWLSNK